jgi:hypothetical protein
MRRKLGLTAAAIVLVALALVQSGTGGTAGLGTFFFGPKLVRAEIIMNEGGVLHDYRVDRGVIRAIAPGSLTLLERDGTLVTVPVAASADIRLGGIVVPFNRLRRGFVATTVRDGSAPASQVLATRR